MCLKGILICVANVILGYNKTFSSQKKNIIHWTNNLKKKNHYY